MRDIHIKIKKGGICRSVDNCIGQDGENLQANLIFEFCDGFIDGTGYVEVQKPDGTKGYMQATKTNETYILPVKSSLLNQVGQLQVQLRITQEVQGEEIPVFKSEIYFLNIYSSINATATIPDEYPTWIDTANAKITEIDTKIEEVETLNIAAEKIDTTTTITITDKQGIEHETEVLDGIQGETGATGTSVTGVEKTSESGLTDTYTMSFSNGETITYDIRNGKTPEKGTDYWTNTDKAEMLTDVLASEEVQQIEVDVASANETSQEAKNLAKQCNKAKGYANYQTLITELNTALNTDYLVSQSFLVQTLEVPDLWVYSVEQTSTPYTYVDDATLVSAIKTNGFVQVGYYKISMLETLKQDLSNYIEFNNVPTVSKTGVIYKNNLFGINIENGIPKIIKAEDIDIANKSNEYKSITPAKINYMFSNQMPIFTQAEYDAIVTKDPNLYYCIVEEE